MLHIVVLALSVVVGLCSGVQSAAEDSEVQFLDDFAGALQWSQSDWADADADASGRRHRPRIEPGIGPDGESGLSVTMSFTPGGYSQGVLDQAQPGDWTDWDTLAVDLKLMDDISDLEVMAKAVVFPDHRWTEAGDAYAVALKPGSWVTLRVPLDQDAPADYWSPEMRAPHWASIRGWAVKFFANPVPDAAGLVEVRVARPRLERRMAAPATGAADDDGSRVEETALRGGLPSNGLSGTSVTVDFRLSPGSFEPARIPLVELRSEGDNEVPLTVTLHVTPGLIGYTASLRLESRLLNLFPPHLEVIEDHDAGGTFTYVELWQANTFDVDTDYRASLSIASETGLTSVSLRAKGDEALVEGHLHVPAFAERFGGALLGAAVSSDEATPFVERGPVEVTDQFVRLGEPFGIGDRPIVRVKATDDAEPFNWVVRQETRRARVHAPLRIAWRGLHPQLPGHLRFAADDEVIWQGEMPEASELELPAGTLPAGRHEIVMAYVDGAYHLELARTEIEVIRATLTAAVYVDRGVLPMGQVQGHIRLRSDTRVDGLALRIVPASTNSGEPIWSDTVTIEPSETFESPIAFELDAHADLTMKTSDVQHIPDVDVAIYWSKEGFADYFRQIVSDHPQLAYRPDEPVERAEVVAALTSLLGLKPQETVTISNDNTTVDVPFAAFADTSGEAWYHGALQAAMQTGILTAAVLHAGRFEPERAATMSEAAAFLVRAREFLDVRSNLPERPRNLEAYAQAAEEWGWGQDSDRQVDALTWDGFIAGTAEILSDVPVSSILSAAKFELRMVTPGTERYLPDQVYQSVGTFGLWSRGTDVRAVGWLGNEHNRGLPTFSWRPRGGRHELYWHLFHEDATDLTLGSIELPGAVRARSYTVRDAASAVWDFTATTAAGDVETSVYLSRAFPAVLYRTGATNFSWVSGDLTLEALYFTGENGRLQTIAVETGQPWDLDGQALGGPWVVANHRLDETGEAIPIFIRLERTPTRIVGKDGRIEFHFGRAADSISVMPLFGVRRMAARRDTTAFEAGLQAAARFWARALGAFPIGLAERYHVDEAAREVEVEFVYDYYDVVDDWATDPLRLAAIPPVVALAEDHGYPVAWGSPIERSDTATFLGPFAYRRGSKVRYKLPLYAGIEQVYTPVAVIGNAHLESIQSNLLAHVSNRQYTWPSPSLDSSLLASHAQMYALVSNAEDRQWYRGRIAASLAELFREANLNTVVQPANSQSYVYNNRIWAAGEDFDREYYIGRQLFVASQVAHWVDPELIRPYWNAIRGLYAYYRIHWDWAWQGSTTFQTGYSFQADGAALSWEGIIGTARMARAMGDRELLGDALFRAASLGASIYALGELTDWVMDLDYAVMNGGDSGEPTRRRPPEEILTGFFPDTYFAHAGVVTTMPTEWGASNWIHDELMGRTRFLNDFQFARIFRWQMITAPKLYPNMSSANYGSHLHTRSILYGQDPDLEEELNRIGLNRTFDSTGATYHGALLRALIPQVWVSGRLARVRRNVWDDAKRRLITEMTVTGDGVLAYDLAWRALDSIDPTSPRPDPGPKPERIWVNGVEVSAEVVRGGWYRISTPVREGQSVRIEVDYGPNHNERA